MQVMIFLSIFTSFIISLMLIPSLIRIAKERNIVDEPGERKLHKAATPLLGGVAIFSGTLISFLFWSSSYFEIPHLFMIASLIILFIAGLIDDLQPLRPIVKLFLQVVAAVITVLFAGITLTGLHGLFGIHTLSGFPAFLISVLFILVMVNGFNFIDGIDGLAASTGIIASALFGILFFFITDGLSAILSFTLCGSLLAFLLFNSSPAKIFMGDTGTLVTGFVLSILTIRLTEETRTAVSSIRWLNYQSAPVIALAILIVPLTDFIRVTAIRLMQGQSPVKADKNHIHHVLVRAGFSHARTSLLLNGINLSFIAAAFILHNINQSLLFFLLLVIGILLSQVPYFILKTKVKKTTS
jgi:UDP-GlcNAc:undecaprenyl-phosphate GlcNAc-1-phosphate transferase